MTTTKTATAPKTASVTLRADRSTWRLVAQRRQDETAMTYATTVDPRSAAWRGRTEASPTLNGNS